jgi:ribulose-phosphate 3-epimerase
MTDPIKIAPSILAADMARFGDEIRAAQAAGADWIHVDVMDGHFVPNLTLGPPVVAALRKVTDLPLDVHLMIEKPELSIPAYADAGADWITVHVEASVHLDRTVHQIREAGVRPGVALNPSTPAGAVANVLHAVDLVLVMTVNPGFGGQAFIPEMLPKIRALRRLFVERSVQPRLEVDGGVTAETAASVVAAGADTLVAGSAVFRSDDYAAAIGAIADAAHRVDVEPAPVDVV